MLLQRFVEHLVLRKLNLTGGKDNTECLAAGRRLLRGAPESEQRLADSQILAVCVQTAPNFNSSVAETGASACLMLGGPYLRTRLLL